MKLIPTNNFVMIPNKLIEVYMKKLTPIEFNFIIVLFYLSQRMSSDKFYRSDKKIIKHFGISANSLNRSRPKLAGYKLIKYKRGFKTGKFSRATRYKLLPSKKLRKLFRIRKSQKGRLSKPP